MYELEYVRKRKTKKFVALGAGVSAVVVTSLAIVAFLGRFVGTFTVSLEAKNVELTLSDNFSFQNSSSFLRVNEVPKFQEFTYSDFAKFGDDSIDSDQTSIDIGANPKNESLNFFKYTFFVKNVGYTPAVYDFSLNIIESSASSDGRYLDDTMRVMVYDNGEKTVYGKRSQTKNMAGDFRSPISINDYEASNLYPFQGYAEMFVSPTVIMTSTNTPLGVGEIRRYTIVTWLEGFRSSNYEVAPDGATIKLGVEINAYENE